MCSAANPCAWIASTSGISVAEDYPFRVERMGPHGEVGHVLVYADDLILARAAFTSAAPRVRYWRQGKVSQPPAGTQTAGLRWQKSGTLRRRISEMKRVMALVLGVALVGASAATTFAQTGTGTGGGTGTKSTTTTTSPTTGATTSRTTTQRSTTEDCPGNAEKSKGKATAHNPNCREVPKR